MVNAMYYSYRDMNGDVFGPYSAQQMMFWYKNRSLSEELEIFVQPENGEHLNTKLKMLIAVNGKEEPFLAVSNPHEEITVVKQKTIKQEIPAALKNPVSTNGKSSQVVLRIVKTEVPRDHDSEMNNNAMAVIQNSNVVSDNKGFNLNKKNQSIAADKIKTEFIPATIVKIAQNQESIEKIPLPETENAKSIPAISIAVTQNQKSISGSSRSVSTNESSPGMPDQAKELQNTGPPVCPQVQKSIIKTNPVALSEDVALKEYLWKNYGRKLEPNKTDLLLAKDQGNTGSISQEQNPIDKTTSVATPVSGSINKKRRKFQGPERTQSISTLRNLLTSIAADSQKPNLTAKTNSVATKESVLVNEMIQKDNGGPESNLSLAKSPEITGSVSVTSTEETQRNIPETSSVATPESVLVNEKNQKNNEGLEPNLSSAKSLENTGSVSVTSTEKPQKSITETIPVALPESVSVNENLQKKENGPEPTAENLSSAKNQENTGSILVTSIAAASLEHSSIGETTSVATPESVLLNEIIQKNNEGPEPTAENLSSAKSQENTGSIPVTSVAAVCQKQNLVDETSPDVLPESVAVNEIQEKDKGSEVTKKSQPSTKDLENTEASDLAISQKATSESLPGNENAHKKDDLRWLDKMISDIETDVAADEPSKSQKEPVPATEVVASKEKSVTGSETVEVAQKVVEKSIDNNTCQKSSENVKVGPGDKESEAIKLEPSKQVPGKKAQKSVEIEEDDDDIQIIAYVPKKTVVKKNTPSVAVPPYKAPVSTAPSDRAAIPSLLSYRGPIPIVPSTSSHYSRPTLRLTDQLPLFGKKPDTDRFLSIDQVEYELFKIVSTMKHMPSVYLSNYPNFQQGTGQLCGLCGQYLRGLTCLFAHLITDDHLAEVRKQSISEADIEFWTTKIGEIYTWGKKNCIIDNVKAANKSKPDIEMDIRQRNIATHKFFSKMWENWNGFSDLCFDILVSPDFKRYCECCKNTYKSPSERLHHLFSKKNSRKMTSLYDQADLDNVKNAVEMMEKVPGRFANTNKSIRRSHILQWKTDYEKRLHDSCIPQPVVSLEKNPSSTDLMKTAKQGASAELSGLSSPRRSPPRDDASEEVPAKRQRLE